MNCNNNQLILFAASNANHARIFMPVAESLAVCGYRINFLSFDHYYAQNAESALRKTQFSVTSLPSSKEIKDWWSYELEQTRPFIEEARLHIDALFFETRPSVLIVGNDWGPIEQTCIRTAEQYGTQTIFLQDGMHQAFPLDPQDRIHSPRLSDGGCDLSLVWTAETIEQLAARGIYGDLRVTGNPRYDRLFNLVRKKSENGYTVLLATQCFARYGQTTPAQEVSMYERILRQLLERKDVRVLIKLHPQTNIEQSYHKLAEGFGERVAIVENEDSLETLEQVDAVVAISSTVYLEALSAGIPSRPLPHFLVPDVEYFETQESIYLSELRSDRFPESFRDSYKRLSVPEAQFRENVDGRATERVVAAISSVINAPTISLATEPKVSVVSVITNVRSTLNLRTLLRKSNFPFELICVDTSQDGEPNKFLSREVRDSRLKVVSAPLATHAQACVLGLTNCRAEIVLRFSLNCISRPGAIENFYNELASNPNATVAFSAYGWRNSFGFMEQLHTAPRNATISQLFQDPAWPILESAYALRCKPQDLAPRLAQINDDFDRQLIAGVVGNLTDPAKVTISSKILYLSPYISNQTPALCRESCSTNDLERADGLA